MNPIDDKIVVMGQSCVGKTTFAKELNNHHYYCFDALFHWHSIEALGLSIKANLLYISDSCDSDKFVIDGWHLGGLDIFPLDVTVYVVFASYRQIIDQYRIPVNNYAEHFSMFKKWYQIDYESLPVPVKYFKNNGEFVEVSHDEFDKFVKFEINHFLRV